MCGLERKFESQCIDLKTIRLEEIIWGMISDFEKERVKD